MKALLAAIIILVFSSCSAVRIINSWSADDANPSAYKKIMVFGLIRENDMELRKDMEQHLVNDLKEQGYNAFSSLEQYGPTAFRGMNEEQVVDTLKKGGIDAVITIVLLSKELEKEYIPARIYYSPYITYQRRFWGYYSVMNTRIYEPGYYQENTKYFWESNLYRMDDGRRLMFSVQTKAFNPSSAASLAHQYGRLIVKNMTDKGVLLKPRSELSRNE